MGNFFFNLPSIVQLAIIMAPILGVGYLWNRYTMRRKLMKLTYEAEEQRIQEVRGELEKIVTLINAGSDEASSEIKETAANPFYRNHLYAILDENKLADHFPKAYLNQISFSESDLAFWLSHPSEIGSPPGKVEFIESQKKSYPDSDESLTFFILKFQIDPPHDLSEAGWLVGITGPYPNNYDNESPIIKSPATFSEFVPLEDMSLTEHLDLILDRLFSTPDTLITSK
ncbi:MAG: hypothetical protein AAF633_01540 [Chloroflexota bacterium]